jgi:hypothetical protein
MTTADIAQLAGVTRRHATGQIVKRPGFPAPSMNASQRDDNDTIAGLDAATILRMAEAVQMIEKVGGA